MAAGGQTITLKEHSFHPLSHLAYQLLWSPSSCPPIFKDNGDGDGDGEPMTDRHLLLASLGQSGSSESRGALQLHGIPLDQGQEHEKLVDIDKPSPVRCGSWLPSTSQLATGDFQGRLAVDQLADDGSMRPVYQAHGHGKLISAVGCSSATAARPEVVTAGMDGLTCVWDVRQRDQPVRRLMPASGQRSREAWTAVFRRFEGNEVVVGYDDGTLLGYDLRTNRITRQYRHALGICSLEEVPSTETGAVTLLLSTPDSQIATYCFPAGGDTAIQTLTSETPPNTAKTTVWAVKNVPAVAAPTSSCKSDRGSHRVASCNGLGTVNVYDYDAERRSLTRVASRSVCSQPILSVDFHPNMSIPTMAISSLDRAIRIFTIRSI